MRLRLLIASSLLVAAAVACFVPALELGGKACDVAHPCISGYDCVDGLCRETATPDGGALVPCSGSSRFCSPSGDWYECRSNRGALLAACAGATCDPLRGCLSPCSSGTCTPGFACDTATDLCLKRPICADAGECPSVENCHSGACIADPPSAATAKLPGDGGTTAADLSCYPTSGSPGGNVTMTGIIVTPVNVARTSAQGWNVRAYRASEFETQPSPTPIFLTTVSCSGTCSYTGPVAVPVNTRLVASVEGPGAVTTYQYLRLPPGAGDPYSQNLISYVDADWADLVQAAEVTPQAARGGLVGRWVDCDPSNNRAMVGATAGLDVGSHAFYSYPLTVSYWDAFTVDPEATATGGMGRFFFFDVPALTTSLVLVPGGAGTPLSLPVRVMPNSITVVHVQLGQP